MRDQLSIQPESQPTVFRRHLLIQLNQPVAEIFFECFFQHQIPLETFQAGNANSERMKTLKCSSNFHDFKQLFLCLEAPT